MKQLGLQLLSHYYMQTFNKIGLRRMIFDLVFTLKEKFLRNSATIMWIETKNTHLYNRKRQEEFLKKKLEGEILFRRLEDSQDINIIRF